MPTKQIELVPGRPTENALQPKDPLTELENDAKKENVLFLRAGSYFC